MMTRESPARAMLWVIQEKEREVESIVDVADGRVTMREDNKVDLRASGRRDKRVRGR